jgi:uncharacterized protein (TIGR03435 family)
MTRLSVGLACLWCGIAVGQTPAAGPAFEVASIRTGAPFSMELLRSGGIGMKIEGARVVIHSWSLADLVGAAYRVRTDQISGAAWIGQQRFDVQAKIPDGVSPDKVPEMLQSLLADRFRMKANSTQKLMSVYALTAGKGRPRLRESEAGDLTPSGCVLGASGHRECHRMTMEDLASMLTQLSRMFASMPPGGMTWGINLPAIDVTGIKGVYDFSMDFGPGSEDAGGGSVADAVERLGLQLEMQKHPYPFIVIDQMEKLPTEN